LSSELQKKTGRPSDTAKREAVIAAATRAFFAHGFAASSIEQIAADAGVSKVTIYNNFGDKRALFVAAVEAQCETMRGHFSIDQLPPGSLRERLTAIGQAMVAFLSRPEMVQFERRIAAETEHEPEIGAAFLAAGPHRMKQAFAQFLRAMVLTGELDIGDPELAAEQFAGMCKGMGDLERRFGHPGNVNRDLDRIEGAVDIFCRAYATSDN
jgi:TetR/AcrR family transcriptional repressor of mexJK operon